MEELLQQVSSILGDAHAFTPELISRIGVLLSTYAEWKIAVANALLWTAGGLTLLTIGGAFLCDALSSYHPNEGTGAIITVGALIVTGLTIGGVVTRLTWVWALRMIEADPLAWLALKAMGM